jgi:hypothetical protein
MEDVRESSPSWLDLLHPVVVGRFLLRPRPRWVVCWLVALAFGVGTWYESWICYNDSERRDGNSGHTYIDFGGQYTIARMVYLGRGNHLYRRSDLCAVLHASFPRCQGKLSGEGNDAQALHDWMVYTDEQGLEHLGGMMYPPIHAVLYSPLAVLRPQPAYRLTQVLIVLAVFFSGWLVERISDGRVWWPVATVVLILIPGFSGAINLGQNSVFTLAILLAGWWQLKEGHPWRGGMVWGLLAYKPVWAASFFLAPLLLRRWRFALAMALTGMVLIAATVPVVGVQAWHEWLEVGKIGSFEYTRQGPWIHLGRDLISLPRRWLLEFEGGIATDKSLERPLHTILGTILWLTPVAVTVLVALLRRRQLKDLTGPGAAFILLGAYFACYHFMYYDFLLAALPLVLLFAEPERFIPMARWRRPLAPLADSDSAAHPWLFFVLVRGGVLETFVLRPRWWLTSLEMGLLIFLLISPGLFVLWSPDHPSLPWDTFCLLALWLLCGWETLTLGRSSVAPVGFTEKSSITDGATILPAEKEATVIVSG